MQMTADGLLSLLAGVGWGWGGGVVRVRRLNLSTQIFDVSERGEPNGKQTRRGWGRGSRRVRRPSPQQLSYYTPTPPAQARRGKIQTSNRWKGGRGAGGRGGRRAQAKGPEPRASCTSEPPTPTSSGGEPRAQSLPRTKISYTWT